MEHQFNVEIAKQYGVEEAVLIHNIAFWLIKNKANEKNYYDGYYWTFNSARALSELFPYFNRKKISRLLNRLEDIEVLKSGNYNKSAYDRTKWYTIMDKDIMNLYKLSVENPISKKCPIDWEDVSNEKSESVQPIPDNIPYNKTYNNISTDKSADRKLSLFEDWWNKYNVKDRGSKSVAKKLFVKLTLEDIELVNKHTDYYIKVTEKKYRKNGDRYLRERIFECEISNTDNNNKDNTVVSPNRRRL